ncbi:MAG: argC, partial [Sphingomonas bacterium]|nr:argC [Sphingomonas bacterium]
MTIRVFIDGAAGTTGLEIHDRLTGRGDISVVTLPEARRKDAAARADALNAADAVILCLPDEAAREAVSLIENRQVRVIDASTAHRTDPTWAYGFAELEPEGRQMLSGATRVSNPGCYPTGFLALVRPLVRSGLLPADALLNVNATSGYSGGGKAMIAEFQQPDGTTTGLRAYALGLAHKHVPEMQKHAGLDHPPIFAPAVARSYRGMLVEVPIHLHALPASPRLEDVREVLEEA